MLALGLLVSLCPSYSWRKFSTSIITSVVIRIINALSVILLIKETRRRILISSVSQMRKKWHLIGSALLRNHGRKYAVFISQNTKTAYSTQLKMNYFSI